MNEPSPGPFELFIIEHPKAVLALVAALVLAFVWAAEAASDWWVRREVRRALSGQATGEREATPNADHH